MNWGDSNGKKWEDYDTIICPDGYKLDMAKLMDDQQRAKAALIHTIPWVSGLVSKLKFIYTFKVQTQATDGFHLFVNPQFTNGLSFTEKVFVMAHEVMHCLLQHMRRGKAHDPQKSNIAADYECNITLADIEPFSFDMIKNAQALIDKKYKNMGYEAIYADVTGSEAGKGQNNDKQANQAEQNQQQNQGGENQQGSGGGNQQQQYSDDYKAGWAKALEDYKNGKLKL